MTVTRDILNSHPVSSLKKELGKAKKSLNYGTLKKSELIDLMLKHKEHFNHIKKYEPPPRKQRQKKFKVGESITFAGATKTKPRKDLVRNETYQTKPKPEPPKPKPERVSADCFSAYEIAKKVIEFYKENKGIFARDKYLIKNKKDLEEKINTIKKILNDPRCENAKTRPPFRPFLEEALKLHLEKPEPKKRQKKFKVGESITFGGATKPKPRKNLIRNETYQKTGGKR